MRWWLWPVLLLLMAACGSGGKDGGWDGQPLDPWPTGDQTGDSGAEDGWSDREPAGTETLDPPDGELGDEGAPRPLCPELKGFQMFFLDVGQGDAILLRFPAGSTMLIDGGNNGNGSGVILPWMEEYCLDQLDYMVVTHADADHCGGLDEVVNALPVGQLWENGLVSGTVAWTSFSDAIDKQGVSRLTVHRGTDADIDGCFVEVINADEGWGQGDANGNSLVLAIDCQGITLLLTGDAHQGTQENLIWMFEDDLKSDVVKLPHHGSADHDPEFATYVDPALAVCSVGKGNPYGHPNPQVLAGWQAVGAHIYRTDNSGTITITAIDGTLKVKTEK